MSIYFAIAGGLVIIVGLAHSVLGELLLLRRLTSASLPPLPSDIQPLRRTLIAIFGTTGEQGLRTLRFTWHLPVVFGFGFAAILLRLSMPSDPATYLAFIQSVMALSFLAASLLILTFSRGRHPGWAAFLVTAILIWLART